MASRKNWQTDDLIQMTPITEDHEYGYAIFKAYGGSFSGIFELFSKGASGMCLGNDSPDGMETLLEVMGSGLFSRPEDYQVTGIPMMSGGSNHVVCEVKSSANNNFRHFRAVRLQANLAELIEADYPKEETGSVAVNVLHALARNGFVPINREHSFVLHKVTINTMLEDDEHEEPWIAVEIDLFAHNHTIIAMPLPYDVETGQVKIDDLNEMAKQKRATN